MARASGRGVLHRGPHTDTRTRTAPPETLSTLRPNSLNVFAQTRVTRQR
jgi:hypothetical protein